MRQDPCHGRSEVDPDFVIRTNRRTRSPWMRRRSNAPEAGPTSSSEGLRSEDEFELLAKASPGHLLANMTEFGKTPIIPLDRFEEMGYSIVIYPLSMMRVAMGAVVRGLEILKRDGSVEGLLDEMQDRAALYELLNYVPGAHWTFPGTGS